MKLIRWFFEQRVAATVRHGLWLHIARRDSLGTSEIARVGGYSELDTSSEIWPNSGKLKKMFLLGSGGSVNELDSDKLQLIAEGVSIGINAWVLHPFVPDMYSFETGQDGDGPSEETKLVSEKLGRSAVVKKNPKLIYLRPTPPATAKNLVRVPPGFANKPIMYGRANLVTQSKKNLQSDLRRIARAASKGSLPTNVLLDNGASVVRLIWLSVMQGFKDIVLVGIDLNSSSYFWYENPKAFGLDREGQILVRPTGTAHNSLETYDRPFPVDLFIEQLNIVLREEMGVVLWTSSRSSSLARFLPVYTWSAER